MSERADSGRVLRLERISRNVADLARAVAFYRDALGFSVIEQHRIDDPAWAALLGLPGARAQAAQLRLGAQRLELVAFDPPGRPYPPDSTSADLWFQHIAIVVAEMPAAYAQLCRQRFEPITEGGPQTLPPNTGDVSAFKFRDPDGHPLELIRFPAGVGAPCWQQARGLFLGIDHSAVAIDELSLSVGFYTQLSLHVAARSLNRGPEQQKLDHLPEVRVDVIAMQPPSDAPPHVELLAYQHPRGRRLHETAANDIAADRLVFEVDDLSALLGRIDAGGAQPRAVTRLADGRDAFLLRDPSGHRLQLESATGRRG